MKAIGILTTAMIVAFAGVASAGCNYGNGHEIVADSDLLLPPVLDENTTIDS